MIKYDDFIKRILIEAVGSVVKLSGPDFHIVKANTYELLRSINGYTYIILLEERYIMDIKGDAYPRDTLFKSIRPEILDNQARLTLLFTNNIKQKKYLIDLLDEYNDLPQFPVLDISEFYNSNITIPELAIQLLLSYPHVQYFSRLNPYSIDSIPKGKMFYGRGKELQRIIEADNNIILVGSRRIGKTTLVHNLKEIVGTIGVRGHRLTKANINKCVIIDVSNLSFYEFDIWEKILEGFNYDKSLYLPFARKNRGKVVFNNYVDSLGELIDKYSGELIIVFDEVDNWILDDSNSGWKVLNTIRSLSDNGKAKIILVGYETLRRVSRKHDFPLFGRFELLKLKPLLEDEVYDLVTQPLEELGICFDDKYRPQILHEIWELSRGRPNIVQGFCLELIRTMKDRQKVVITDRDFISAKNTSSVYKNYIDSISYGGSTFAQLICGVASKITEEDISIPIKEKEIIEEIKRLGVRYDSLLYEDGFLQLDLRHFLILASKKNGLYKFTDKRIPKEFLLIFNNIGYLTWSSDLVRKHKEEYGNIKY